MLTGRYPTRRGVAPSYTEYPDNLFTMLAGSYNVRAFETVTQLCPPRVCTATTGDRAGVWARIVSPRRSDENPAAQFSEDTVRERQQAAGATPKKPGPTFRFDQLKANQPARFADFLEQLVPVLTRRGGVHVIIGHENTNDAMHEVSLVFAPYGSPGRALGVLGVLGPTRMAYPRAIPTVRYLAALLDELIDQNAKDA